MRWVSLHRPNISRHTSYPKAFPKTFCEVHTIRTPFMPTQKSSMSSWSLPFTLSRQHKRTLVAAKQQTQKRTRRVSFTAKKVNHRFSAGRWRGGPPSYFSTQNEYCGAPSCSTLGDAVVRSSRTVRGTSSSSQSLSYVAMHDLALSDACGGEAATVASDLVAFDQRLRIVRNGAWSSGALGGDDSYDIQKSAQA